MELLDGDKKIKFDLYKLIFMKDWVKKNLFIWYWKKLGFIY